MMTGAKTALAIVVGGVSALGRTVARSPPRGRPIFVQANPMRAMTIPALIIRSALVMPEEAATAGVEAIDAACRAGLWRGTPSAATGRLDSFQSSSDISLESLEKAFFPFASLRGLSYPSTYASLTGFSVSMIVCSCNVLTDHDVRSAVNAAEDLPRNAKQLYGCLGCSAECGRCARTIKGIIEEALGACAKACCSGCPHSQAAMESHIHAGFLNP
jgi:bacterioferritin-associated ferredoxin